MKWAVQIGFEETRFESNEGCPLDKFLVSFVGYLGDFGGLEGGNFRGVSV